VIRATACGLMACFAFLANADEPPAKKDEKKVAAPIQAGMFKLLLEPKGDTPAAKELAEIFKAADAEARTTEQKDASKVIAATIPKVVAHARKHPTDESTLEALVWAISLLRQSSDMAKIRSEAIELVKTNFAKSPAIRKYLRSLANPLSDEGIDLVRDVFKNHPEKLTQAHAAKVLISGLELRVKYAEMLGKNEQARASAEKQLGMDTVQKLIDAAPQAAKDAETFRTALRTELKGQLPDLEIGAVAPETISVNLDGKTVKLSELKGKVVVLDFWATWCGPCRAMIPHTRDLVKSQEAKPFVFVSISVDDEKETLTNFMEKTPMPWAHWWDGKKAVSQQWDVEGYPTLYVIDHKGVIRFKTLGYDPKSGKLDTTVEELVKAAEAGK
jgi:thiol-disulfide isomerase/thioredoxin